MVTLKHAFKRLPDSPVRKILGWIWHEYKWTYQLLYFATKHPSVKVLRLRLQHQAELKRLGFRSQFGQDHFLNKLIFQNKRDGFFIDIGANDPEYNSNSHFFEKKLGWHGLAIEPQNKFQQKWATSRSAEFINVGVGSQREHKKFIQYNSPNSWEDQLSCVAGHEREEDENLPGEIYDIPILPLSEIIAERHIEHIDLLSIDVEGYEEEVLKGIDFGHVRPNIVLLENMAHIRGREDLRDLMKANGYKLVYRIWTTDDVYVDDTQSTG